MFIKIYFVYFVTMVMDGIGVDRGVNVERERLSNTDRAMEKRGGPFFLCCSVYSVTYTIMVLSKRLLC